MSIDRLSTLADRTEGAIAPRLCAKASLLVAPHMPRSLLAQPSPLTAAIDMLENVAEGGDGSPASAWKLAQELIRFVDEKQLQLEEPDCLPVAEAIVASLEVIACPGHDLAYDALLAAYTAAELKSFMCDGHSQAVHLRPASDVVQELDQAASSDAVQGFLRVLETEAERLRTAEPKVGTDM